MKIITIVGTQYVTWTTSIELEDDEEFDTDNFDIDNYGFGEHTITNIIDDNGNEVMIDRIGEEF